MLYTTHDGNNIIELECGTAQERRKVRIEIEDDGRVIVSGAPEVDILYPYRRGKDQLEFVHDGVSDGIFRVSAEMPGTAGDLQVMLIDETRLMRKRPWQWSLTVETEPNEKTGKMRIIARDGIGDWFKERVLSVLRPSWRKDNRRRTIMDHRDRMVPE
ncbi:MAG: hypothetical protein AAB367_04545 [Patescibacteria group bacterium]